LAQSIRESNESNRVEEFYGINPTGGYGMSINSEQNEFDRQLNTSEPSLLRSTPQTIGFSVSFNSPFTSFIGSASRAPMNTSSGFTPKRKKEVSSLTQPLHNLTTPIPIKPTVTSGVDSYYGQGKTAAILSENPVPSKFSANPMYTSSPALLDQNFLPMPRTPVSASQPMILESISSSNSGVKSNDLDDNIVPKKTIKKEKNRVSAQKCRLRKKQYIVSLELKIEELTAELEKCKDELQTLKSKKEVTTTQQSLLNEYNNRHMDSIKKLEGMMIENQTEENLCELIKIMNVKLCLTL